jgi:ankyrin repeat protein
MLSRNFRLRGKLSKLNAIMQTTLCICSQGVSDSVLTRMTLLKIVQAVLQLSLGDGKNLLNTYQGLTDTPPLLIALRKGCSTDVISVMIECGADVHATGRYGQTSLMAASTVAAAQLLLDAGAAVNARCSLGSTVLHALAERGVGAGVICCLLKAGADATATDTLGCTPAEVALAFRHSSLAGLLQRAAADQQSNQQQQQAETLTLPECLTLSSADTAWRSSTDALERRGIQLDLMQLRPYADDESRAVKLQRLEFELYKSALSLAEYKDEATVAARVSALPCWAASKRSISSSSSYQH